MSKIRETVWYRCKTRLKKAKLEVSYALRLWDLANKTLRECDELKMEANHLDTYRALLKKQNEEVEGKYDWPTVRKDAEQFDSKVADYYGAITIDVDSDWINGRPGRIVTMARDVKAGDLIMVEKAIYTAPAELFDGSASFMVDASNPDFDYCQVNLLPRLVHALLADPSKHAVMDTLCPGHTRVSPIIKESKRIAMIKEGLGDIDIDSLRRDTYKYMSMCTAPDWETKHMVLFAVSSLISHSCIPNAIQETIGDVGVVNHPLIGTDQQVRVIRARSDLKAGDIVTLDLLLSSYGYLGRTCELKERLGLFCDCLMCQYDRGEDYMGKYEHMQDWHSIETSLFHDGHDDGNEMTRTQVRDMKEMMFSDFAGRLLDFFDRERPPESVWPEFQTIGSSAMAWTALSEDVTKIEVGPGCGGGKGDDKRNSGLWQWLQTFLHFSGAVVVDQADRERTGLMVRRIPPRGHIGDICPGMLHLAYLHQRKYVESGDEEDVSNLPLVCVKAYDGRGRRIGV